MAYVVVNFPDHDELSIPHEILRVLCEQEKHPGLEVVRGSRNARFIAMGVERSDGATIKLSNALTSIRLVLRVLNLYGKNAFEAYLIDQSLESSVALPHDPPFVSIARRRVALRSRFASISSQASHLLGRLNTKSVSSVSDDEKALFNLGEGPSRVIRSLRSLNVAFVARVVPSNYYSLPLASRAALVGAPSTWYMFKTLVLENSRHPSSSQHANVMMVIVQYAAEGGFDTKALNVWWRNMTKLPKSAVNWRLSSRGEELTQFGHNGVCPFGSALNNAIVVVDACAQSRLSDADNSIWLGAGHPDAKVKVDINDAVKALKAHLVPLTPEKKE